MGLGLLISESKRFQFATLRLRGRPGRDGYQSASWDCFGDRICRHVENASPKTVPQCTLTTISTLSPAQGLYLWGKRAVRCGGKGKKNKNYRRSPPPIPFTQHASPLASCASTSHLTPQEIHSVPVVVRYPLWNRIQPGYSKETIREVVLSTGVYSLWWPIYGGTPPERATFFWLQV